MTVGSLSFIRFIRSKTTVNYAAFGLLFVVPDLRNITVREKVRVIVPVGSESDRSFPILLWQECTFPAHEKHIPFISPLFNYPLLCVTIGTIHPGQGQVSYKELVGHTKTLLVRTDDMKIKWLHTKSLFSSFTAPETLIGETTEDSVSHIQYRNTVC